MNVSVNIRKPHRDPFYHVKTLGEGFHQNLASLAHDLKLQNLQTVRERISIVLYVTQSRVFCYNSSNRQE